MLGLQWFLRMAKWARRPPSARMVALVLVVLALSLALFALEWAGLWPDALTVNGRPKLKLQ